MTTTNGPLSVVIRTAGTSNVLHVSVGSVAHFQCLRKTDALHRRQYSSHVVKSWKEF